MPPPVQVALNRVKAGIGAVGKNDRNTAQGFNFRGVDAVVNAAAPLLNEHGIVVLPRVVSHSSYEYATKNGTQMRSLTVEVEYSFVGPAGDELVCTVLAEASDSGDKGAPKAMSVAYRVALLQVLNLPTDDPDPDSVSHERATRAETQDAGDWWAENGWRDEADHDAHKEATKAAAAGLSDASKETLKAWAEATGLPKKVMTHSEWAEYAGQVSALEAGESDGSAPF